MREDQIPPIVLTPQSVLQGTSPLVLTAALRPVAGLDRFQPAGFPEIGHVIYKAPRKDGGVENICIVDSPASMANHLESVCMRGAHDLELNDDLAGMPYLRCVTGDLTDEKKLPLGRRQLVVTSLTEGHRIASTYFLEGKSLADDDALATVTFAKTLEAELGIKLPGSKKAHPPAEKWWDVFRTILKYDPNALVHGVLFPQYQIKIARFLTAHLEAFGAARVDRSGVKFDRLGKTTSGQPIFAVDDATAGEIRATFILDVAFLQSFGRTEKKDRSDSVRGLSETQKEFLAALALWKIDRLLKTPFRYRSGCHLELITLKHGEENV
ncbi:MAG TPA: type I-U CRISPR-associated protein Cas7, partial [Roseiarcus sp.]|nr:type I-U CRISPR-associated protein Cas7 [Roseiarcus sp.]